MTCVKTESSGNRFSRIKTDCDATKRAKTARGIMRGFLVIRTEKTVLSPVKRLLSKKKRAINRSLFYPTSKIR